MKKLFRTVRKEFRNTCIMFSEEWEKKRHGEPNDFFLEVMLHILFTALLCLIGFMVGILGYGLILLLIRKPIQVSIAVGVIGIIPLTITLLTIFGKHARAKEEL